MVADTIEIFSGDRRHQQQHVSSLTHNCNHSSGIMSQPQQQQQQQQQPSSERNERGGGEGTSTEAVGVTCCSCFAPRRQRYRTTSVPRDVRRESIYFDAVQDLSYSQSHGSLATESSLAYFDAVEDLPQEDDYPTIPTKSIPKRIARVSMIQPETLLRPTEPRPQEDDYEAEVCLNAELRHVMEAGTTGGGGGGRQGSLRRMSIKQEEQKEEHHHDKHHHKGGLKNKIFRRGTVQVQQDLEETRIALSERGYPGQLNQEELAECLKFYREIHKHPGSTSLDIVYCFSKVEEEPYSLCRFLRATKFDANAILQRLKDGEATWEVAKANAFYPNLSQALGISLPLFLKMYPLIYHGNAKNGCPVSYFKAGQINTEGLLCLSTTEKAARYYWNQFVYIFQDMIVRAKQKNENFVRCEALNVIDLKGMSSSQMTSEAMDVLKQVAAISNFFPETLHCLLVLNAPTWFGFVWPVIKSFIDPRTAQKIEVYSREAAGKARLAELVDLLEIPEDFGGAAPSMDVLMSSNDKKENSANHTPPSSPASNDDDTPTKGGDGDDEEEDCRREVEVVFLKRNETKKINNFMKVAEGEVVKIQVHTRSITGAEITVYMKDEMNGDKNSTRSGSNIQDSERSGKSSAHGGSYKVTDAPVHVGRDWSTTESTTAFHEQNMPKPFMTDICQDIVGPGTISFEIKGLVDAPDSVAANKKLSQGYFLILGKATAVSSASSKQPTTGAGATEPVAKEQ